MSRAGSVVIDRDWFSRELARCGLRGQDLVAQGIIGWGSLARINSSRPVGTVIARRLSTLFELRPTVADMKYLVESGGFG